MRDDDVQPTAAMVSLRRIIRYLRLADREIEGASGLSAAQLFVLTALADEPALSLAQIAERALTDQSSVSTVVARLVERKLIARKPSAKDRRKAELRLTPAGRRVLDDAPQTPQVRLIEAIRAMPPARRTELVRSLEGLVSAIGARDVHPRLFFQDEAPRTRKK